MNKGQIVRSKAPLRIGFAGGGSDVSPYSENHGGAVLNATINMYAYTSIYPLVGDKVEFLADDIGSHEIFSVFDCFTINDGLLLHRAVYRKMMTRFNNGVNLALKVLTYSDAPPGSGLGSSSTLVVSMIQAYKDLMNIPLGDYDIARLAYEIERVDCGLIGGKQDQYAATFGGFNFIEFFKTDSVIVNPLRIRSETINELEGNLILYFTGKSRESAAIIKDQMNAVNSSNGSSLDAMHAIKKSAFTAKNLLLKADIAGLAIANKMAWEAKKLSSASISNVFIEDIADSVLAAGARSIKISGAGGGGFMLIFVEPLFRQSVLNVLGEKGGKVQNFKFVNEGCSSWKV